ncbi:MAG: DUF2087 domain-containing protein [Eubacteriales bacterium]
MEMIESKVKFKAFLDEDGKIVQIPVPLQKKLCVLSYLAEKFEADKQYREKEVNGIIQEWHTFNDYFILRRLLVDYGFLCRRTDGSAYWVQPPERNTL